MTDKIRTLSTEISENVLIRLKLYAVEHKVSIKSLLVQIIVAYLDAASEQK